MRGTENPEISDRYGGAALHGVGTRPLRYGKTYQEKTVPDMLGAYIGNAPPTPRGGTGRRA